MKYLKFLTTSLIIFGAGTIINCYGMESNYSLQSNINFVNNKLSSDARCKRLVVGPIVCGKAFSIHNKSSTTQIKLKVDEIIDYCDKNASSLILRDAIINCAIMCNQIASALYHMCQIFYIKGLYTKDNHVYDEWRQTINKFIEQGNTENNFQSAQLFYFHSIEIFPKFLQDINQDVEYLYSFYKPFKNNAKVNFKVFDNPNYLNENINILSLFKYLGNRVLEISHECFDDMHTIIKSDNSENREETTKYLEKNIFCDIICPLYDVIQLINNKLCQISKAEYMNWSDYCYDTVKKYLKSTTDYIEDVLKSSKIKKWAKYFQEHSKLPRKIRI